MIEQLKGVVKPNLSDYIHGIIESSIPSEFHAPVSPYATFEINYYLI
jgi:hypothetical protein